MEVVVAESAGTCYGVKRALDLACELARESGPAQTLGPLIHNPIVVEALAEKGVTVAHALDEIQSDRVVIRSHGVTPEVRDQLEALSVDVVDATCPHVLRAQKAAYKLAQDGYQVIVLGNAEHPEVLSLLAWARRGGSEPLAAASTDDLPAMLDGPIGIVAQTTLPHSVLDAVVVALEARGLTVEVRDTICSATVQRQEAACRLAAEVDAMVVVGGRNSSNTTHLHELCQAIAPRSFHIESPEELSRGDFEGVEKVGVTAGASTPDDQIAAVVDLLQTW